MISRRDIEDAWAHADHSLRRARDADGSPVKKVTSVLTQTIEVAAGATAVGVLSGRFGPLEVNKIPIPLDLAGGVVGHGLTMFFAPKRLQPHLHNVFDGVMAGWFTKFGVGLGTSMRMKAGLPPVVVSGVMDAEMQAEIGRGAQALPANANFHAAAARHHGRRQPQTSGRGPLSEAELMGLAQQVA